MKQPIIEIKVHNWMKLSKKEQAIAAFWAMRLFAELTSHEKVHKEFTGEYP